MGAEPAEIVDERRHYGLRAVPATDVVAPGVGTDRPSRESRGRDFAAKLGALLEEEWERGTAFLFLPVAMAAGALTFFSLAEEPSLPVLVAVAMALIATLRLTQERFVPRAIAAAGLLFVTGLLAAQLETLRAGTPMNGSEVATTVTGRVVQVEHQASGRVRLTIDILDTERPRLRYAPQRVRLSARAVPEGTLPGALVEERGQLMPLSGPVRPGGYDFAFNGYFDGIGAVGFFYRDPVLLSDHPAAPPLSALQSAAIWTETLRLALAERVRAQIGGAEGEIAATLIAGIRAGIPEETAEALRRTGMAHILAISGLHMALVAGTVLLGFRAVFALFPDFSSRHPVKKYAALAALVACAFYLAISGAAVAAQRSFIMLAVMLVALLFDRAALTMRNLAIAALIVVSISPHEVTGPSFHMSFAATAALIGAYAAWSERRSKGKGRMSVPPANLSLGARILRGGLYFLGGLAMTSIIAGLATGLYGAYHFHRVPPLALIANLAAMPAVTAIVMPFAVLSVLAMPFGLDGPLLWVMGVGLSYVNWVAERVSELSPFDAVGLLPPAAVLVLTLALVLATLPSTALRLAALVPALLGAVMLLDRTLPEVLVSEDARLVAVRTGSDGLAVNRERPNAFTIQNWTRALGMEEFYAPSAARAAGRPGFACAEAVCQARTGSGHVVAHAADAEGATRLCAAASVIVIADATAENPCGEGVLVLTARDLARRGSAAITFSGGRASLELAIPEPYRAWHEHRRFSRAARGLAPREAN